MFNIKPIITRREEKLVIKLIKSIDHLQKEYDKERKKRPHEALGFSSPTFKISNDISERVKTLVELFKTIYLDK